MRLVEPASGRELLQRAIDFCAQAGYHGIYLTTFAGLEAASHVYQSFGFRLVSEADVAQWQGGVPEQHFERVA